LRLAALLDAFGSVRPGAFRVQVDSIGLSWKSGGGSDGVCLEGWCVGGGLSEGGRTSGGTCVHPSMVRVTTFVIGAIPSRSPYHARFWQRPGRHGRARAVRVESARAIRVRPPTTAAAFHDVCRLRRHVAPPPWRLLHHTPPPTHKYDLIAMSLLCP